MWRGRAEQFLLMLVMGLVAVSSISDVIMDWHYASRLHLWGEVTLTLASLAFLSLTWIRLLKQRVAFSEVRARSEEFEAAAHFWQKEAQAHLKGLSDTIDATFAEWKLSPAETEVAWLLLKGLSQKEIATLRNTNLNTVRTQSLNVYAKSGLSGRTELAAYFLEDFLDQHRPIGEKKSAPDPKAAPVFSPGLKVSSEGVHLKLESPSLNRRK